MFHKYSSHTGGGLESIKPTGQDADYGNSTVRKSIIYIFGSNSHL